MGKHYNEKLLAFVESVPQEIHYIRRPTPEPKRFDFHSEHSSDLPSSPDASFDNTDFNEFWNRPDEFAEEYCSCQFGLPGPAGPPGKEGEPGKHEDFNNLAKFSTSIFVFRTELHRLSNFQ